jgi:hypothetical protein
MELECCRIYRLLSTLIFIDLVSMTKNKNVHLFSFLSYKIHYYLLSFLSLFQMPANYCCRHDNNSSNVIWSLVEDTESNITYRWIILQQTRTNLSNLAYWFHFKSVFSYNYWKQYIILIYFPHSELYKSMT